MLTHPSRLRFRTQFLLAATAFTLFSAAAFAQDNNQPPKGFTALFNGQDFKDWTFGLTKPPAEIAAMSSDERAKMQDELHKHWHVDNGDIVSDGHDPYLATPRDYGDFEMWVDWKIGANGDSGIYLRGVPQVQIWDPSNKKVQSLGADKGSGGLWNNKKNVKDPLVLADNPIGEWNRMYIRMVGPYVLVKLNDKKVVDNVILENYYDANIPIYNRGPIYLQTHGNETRFRNVFLREIPAEESNRILGEIKGGHAGFKPIFNGKDLSGWKGATDSYAVVDGTLKCVGGKHGNLFTDESYDNFVASLEFKLPPGGNNGLAIRAPITDGDVAYEGMEVQVLDNTASQYDKLHEYQYCGSLYGLSPALRGYLRPVGEWNHEVVTVDGDHLTVELNGFEILNTNIAQAREKPMDGKPHPGAARKEGHFGFLGHTDPVAFRNIQIKRLPST